MKTLLILLLLSSTVWAKDIPIADSVKEEFTANPVEKQKCVDAVMTLLDLASKLNARMFYMETHPETGYDIRHEDRTQINILIDQNTNPILEDMNSAAYHGKGQVCINKLKEGTDLTNQIYQANIKYRKIPAR